MLVLNNLILKSKKYIGTYKATDILENKRHAFAFLIQAITADNVELRLLAIKINEALNIAPSLINALNSYIEHIHHTNKTQTFIDNSQQYLKQFAQHLYDIPPNRDAYREASTKFLLDVDKKNYTFCVNLVRQFFSCWQHAHEGSMVENTPKLNHLPQHTKELTRIWQDVDSAFITTIEEAILKRYQQAIQKINILDEEVQIRIKIAKIVMIYQRKYDKTPEGYRTNIADIQGVFSNKDLLNYFLSVSREFYHSWENTMIRKS